MSLLFDISGKYSPPIVCLLKIAFVPKKFPSLSVHKCSFTLFIFSGFINVVSPNNPNHLSSFPTRSGKFIAEPLNVKFKVFPNPAIKSLIIGLPNIPTKNLFLSL